MLSNLITVWLFENARKEIDGTGYGTEILGVLSALAKDGRVPTAWFHPETTDFSAMGPPGTTVRVYYAKHAGQIVVLHAASGKHGGGKLPQNTRRTVEQRLGTWKMTYPEGRPDPAMEEKK